MQADGSVESELLAIVKHYARTWLVADMLLVVGAWAELLAQNMGGALRMLPFFRIARMLRLLRLVRLQRMIARLTDTNSEMLNLIVNFIVSVCAIIVVAHVLACLWVGLGRYSEENWVYRIG